MHSVGVLFGGLGNCGGLVLGLLGGVFERVALLISFGLLEGMYEYMCIYVRSSWRGNDEAKVTCDRMQHPTTFVNETSDD